MPQDVSDARSNPNEQIEHAARVIGKSAHRRLLFNAVYRGKKRAKKVSELASATGLSRMRVLQEGKHLVNNHVVRQEKLDGETAYVKDDFYHINKAIILRLVNSPKKLADYPTKRKIGIIKPPTIELTLNLDGARARAVTIDDVEQFANVRNVAPNGFIPDTVSEPAFKAGVQRILGEQGTFRDWGGEKNDLLTTFLKLGGRRRSAAFAFKGPGLRVVELTPAKLGKNGDQIQRLFQSPADVFFVQYWRGIGESVREQMQQFAIAKSLFAQCDIWYGVIDGQDSLRLLKAYPEAFA